MNWALEQRHLKPAPWRVLVMLADRHNKDTLRVDPEQALLAHDCNMSRSTVNRHLDDLEQSGLLVRVPRLNPVTKKQLPTFYILQINFDCPPDIENAVSDYRTRVAQVQNGNTEKHRVPNSVTVAVSQKQLIPCPKNDDSRVSNPDTNLVKEPVIEPCAPLPAAHSLDEFEDLAERFTTVFPRSGNFEQVKVNLRQAIGAGADPTHILASAKRYAAEQDGNQPRYIAYPENWLAKGRWADFAMPVAKGDIDAQVDARWVEWIKGNRQGVARHVSQTKALDLISRDLVTAAECAAAGIRL